MSKKFVTGRGHRHRRGSTNLSPYGPGGGQVPPSSLRSRTAGVVPPEQRAAATWGRVECEPDHAGGPGESKAPEAPEEG